MRWVLALAAACTPATIDLPDGEPGIGFDDLRYSPRLHRVLVPAGRSGHLDLIDPDSLAVTPIGAFSQDGSYGGGHDFGATSVDDTGSALAVTDRTANTVSLVDETGSVLAHADLTAEPDYVRAVGDEVWVTHPGAGQLSIYDATLHRTGSIAIPGGPESLVVAGDTAFTNDFEGGTYAIDVHTHAVTAWRNGCSGARGIATDGTFVFVSCAEGRVATLAGGHVISEVWPVDGADIIDFDPTRRHLYVPGQISGDVSIVGVYAAGMLGVLGIEDGAVYGHCVTTDDAGRAYVCDPNHGRLIVAGDPFGAIP